MRQALGIDVVGLFNPADMKNGVNNLTQPLTMCDGTPVLIGDNVAYGREEDGSWVIYPQGDRTARPGARMPANGFFFDALDRAQDFDEDDLTPLEDFKDSFPLLNEADCECLRREADRLYNSTDCACWAHWADAAWATWPTFLPQTKSSRGASAALKTG